jgi:hypothetical protein
VFLALICAAYFNRLGFSQKFGMLGFFRVLALVLALYTGVRGRRVCKKHAPSFDRYGMLRRSIRGTVHMQEGGAIT